MATSRHLLPFLSSRHRPAGRPAVGTGTTHSSAPPDPVKQQLLFFRTQWEQSFFSTLGTHECAEEQRGSAQANSPGREMKAVTGRHPQRGGAGRSSNNSPNAQPCATDRPPERPRQEEPCTQRTANTPSPSFAAQGVLVTTFHKWECEREVILFRWGNWILLPCPHFRSHKEERSILKI